MNAHRMKIELVGLLLLTTAAALPADGAEVEVEPYRSPKAVPDTGIGIHYDGSGVVPGEKPPTDFDQKTGRNIRWKVALPQWGNAGLVPVGNRVLHLADTDVRFIWPVLRCYDSATGTLVWERELNPLDALPRLSADERKELTAAVTQLWEDHRVAYRALRSVIAGKADREQAEKELASRGITLDSWSKVSLHRNVGWSQKRKDLTSELHSKYNIQPNLCITGMSRTGDAFGTPVTDGELVYVTTIHGHVAAVRMDDGRVAWMRSLSQMAAPAYREANHFMTSPRLYKDVLLAFWGDTNTGVADVLVAMDKRTGRELWNLEIKGWDSTLNGQWKSDEKHAFNGRPGGSPRILVVDGEPIALLGSGLFVRLRDGKPYKGGVLANVQNYAINHADNTVFGSVSLDGPGSHFGARVSLKGDDLRFESLFFWPCAGFGANHGAHGIWHDGRLYWGGCLVDPATGIPTFMDPKPEDAKAFRSQWRRARNVRGSGMQGGGHFGFGRMFTAIANGHVYGMGVEKKGRERNAQQYGVLYVTSLDGKRVSRNELVQDEQTPQHLLDQGWPEKDQWSYTAPMAIGNDCIYIASDQYLYCIGQRDGKNSK